MTQHESRKRWGVIGGGISGLVAAWELMRQKPDDEVVLFEAADRLGGILGTEQIGPWLVEQAADMFVTQPTDAVDLCRELGIADQLIPTNPQKRGALVAFRGKLHRIPEGFSLMAPGAIWPIASTGLLSLRGKFRLLRERFVPARQSLEDESFESFAIRRCGKEAYERLVQPLVSGIYTADPKLLSMQATSLSRFVEMERRWGSLTRGVLREAFEKKRQSGASGQSEPKQSQVTGARYGMFVAPRGGMQSLIDRLADELGNRIRWKAPVDALQRLQQSGQSQWLITSCGQVESFDGIVLATPAAASAKLLQDTDSALASEMQQVQHASCAVVVLGLKPKCEPPPVFGVIVPNIENRNMIAAALGSHKFPGRAPEGGLLVRVFLGGALNPQIMEQSDESLIAMAQKELREIVGIEGSVELAKVVRWADTMPQYHVGHRERVERIARRVEQLPGLVLIGNAWHGVGIPDCVRLGREAARQLTR